MNDPMLIAASCFLVQALLVPALFLSFGREYGPGGLNLSSIIAAFAGAVLGFIIDINFNLPFSPVFWALVGLLVNGYIASTLQSMIIKQVEREVEMAPRVPAVGLALFDRIDETRTGVIRADQIWSFLRKNEVDEDTKAVLQFIADTIGSIGHVVDVVSGAHYNAMPVCIYGISRRDLQTYPSRRQSAPDGWN